MPNFLNKENLKDNSLEEESLLSLHRPHDIDINSISTIGGIPDKTSASAPSEILAQTKKNISQNIPPLPVKEQIKPLDQKTAIPIKNISSKINTTLSIPSGNITQTSLTAKEGLINKVPQPEIKPSIPPQTLVKPKNKIWQIAKIILVILAIFIFVYLFLNFPALLKRTSYSYQESTGQKPKVQTIIPTSINRNLLFLDTVTHYAPPAKKEEAPKLPSKDDLGMSGLENDQLWVPKLDIRSPIVWDSPVDEATMMANLKYGVVHYKGAAKPGEVAQDGEGNVFISGHSSYYWWDDGKYKTIFANLDKLNEGDEIAVGFNDNAYVYKVASKKEVSPDDTSVLAQNTTKPTLTLMTCVPVGTNLRRLIITAELVARASDKPSENLTQEQPAQPAQPSQTTNTLIPATTTSTAAPTRIPTWSGMEVIDLLPWRW